MIDRLLHTADWMVGGFSALPRSLSRQRRGLSFFTRYAIERRVPFVAICGILFDHPNPSDDEIDVVIEALMALERAGIRSAVIPERAPKWLLGLRDRFTSITITDQPTVVDGVLVTNELESVPEGVAYVALGHGARGAVDGHAIAWRSGSIVQTGFDQSVDACGFLDVSIGDGCVDVTQVRTDAPILTQMRVRHDGWRAALDVIPRDAVVLVSIEARPEEMANIDITALRDAARQVGSDLVIRRSAPPVQACDVTPIDLVEIVNRDWPVDREELLNACKAALDGLGLVS